VSCKQTRWPEKAGAVLPPPVFLERGKLVAVAVGLHRRTLSKQSLRGQVSVKLTPEICINNASSNSRLLAVGRQATAADSHSQTCLQTFFFSLPTFDEKTTKLQLHAEKLTETVLHLNLGNFVGFFFFCAVLFYFMHLL
jgi:DsbC/DsbD-like thiol-disulfide interchange protein